MRNNALFGKITVGIVALSFVFALQAAYGKPEALIGKSISVKWNPVFGNGYRGVWNTGKEMELVSYFPFPENAPAVVLEAEKSSAVLFNDGGGLRKGPDASDGGYIVSPKTIELFLQLKKPTDYDIWYNVRFAGNLEEAKFLQGVDVSLGGDIGWVTLKKENPGWQWIKGNLRHNFKRAGMLELQMTGIPPGLEIDRIALAADTQWKPEPENLKTEVTLNPEPWTNSSLDSGDLFFAQVNRWGKVDCAIAGNQGKTSFQYSLDSGKTWSAVPPNGNLESIPAKGDGGDRIRFKVSLSRKKGELSPLVSPSFSLTYQTSSGSVFSVEDKVCKYFFAKRTGALCGIISNETGRAFTPVDHPAPIFTLCLKKPGFQDEKEWETVSSLEAECLESGVEEPPSAGCWKKLRFRYKITRSEGTADVIVRVSFKEPGESYWECEATNNLDGLEICKLVYPVLDRVKAGDDTRADSLLINGAYLIKNPAIFGHFLYWWPGNSYPMLDISSTKEGISLIAHDTSLRSTGISCMGQQDSVQLRLHKIVDVKKGKTFLGAPNLVRIHSGDWRNACLLERAWANQAFPLVESPLWAEELDIFAPTGWPVPPWNQWGKMAESIRKTTQAPLLCMWNFQIPGTCWTDPHPNPILGDAEDLRFAVKDIHKSGIRFIMYIQSLLANRFTEGNNPEDMIGFIKRKHLWKGWELPEKGFMDKYRIRDAGGKEVKYGAHSDDRESVMNQASSGFQNFKYHWAVEMFGEKLGINGIYWDSDSGMFGTPAWGNSDLYGFDPGLTGKGARDIQMKIRSAYQKSDPGCVFVGEGPPNVLMGGVRDFTLDNVQSLWPFRMLFPKMKILLGSANAADPKRRKAFLSGVRFDGIDSNDKLQESFLWMRRQVKQYLYSADFRDELNMTVKGEGVEAKLFILDPGRNDGAMFNVLNEKNISDASIVLTPPDRRKYSSGWIVDSDGKDQKFTQFTRLDTGEYKISLPSASAAHILLFNRLEPKVNVSCDEDMVAGGKINIKLNIQSLDGYRKKGEIRIETPEGFSAERASYDIGGRDGNRELKMELPLSANINVASKIVDFPIVVSTETVDGDGKIQQQHEFKKVHSAYVHDPVKVQIDWIGPEKLLVRLVNRISQPCSGVLSLTSAKGEVRLAKGDLKIDYALEANGSREYSVETKGAEKAQEPWAFRGELICKASIPGSVQQTGRKTEVYQKFWPIVPNGSLELYRFREGAPEKEFYNYSKNTDKMESFEKNLPDYWWGILSDRSPQLITRPGISIDVQDAGDGARCLKLVPDTIFRSLVPISLVKDRSYRFRMKMKWSAPSQRNYACFVNNSKEGGAFGMIGLKPDAAPGKWHQLEETFKAQSDSATLYFYSGKGTTAWYDDISVVPLDSAGEEGAGNK